MSWFKRLFGKSNDTSQPSFRDDATDVEAKPATEAELRARYRDLVRPAVHLRPGAGMSRLGGLPQMPADLPWPHWKNLPQSFLAQIDLAEIAQVLPSFLPPTGTLFFFYDQEQCVWGFDPKHRGGWQVLYHASDVRNLPERSPPNGRTKDCTYPPRPVVPHRIDLLPDSQRLDRSDFDWDRDGEVYMEVRDAPFGDIKHHQMLGYPSPVQGDEMELECQLASNGIYVGDPDGYKHPRVPELKPGAGEWKLLLQLDSDDDLGWMWGDVGTLYFWIRESDARKADFSNVWMVFQCS